MKVYETAVKLQNGKYLALGGFVLCYTMMNI